GAADVIVTEGFSGNIALKAAEGTARQMSDFLRAAMGRTWRSKLGYLFARKAFRELRDKLDPKKSNGGVLLGLNGVVVKSHGGTDAEGFAYAVDVGYEMVRYDLLTKINQMLNREGGALSAVPAEAVSCRYVRWCSAAVPTCRSGYCPTPSWRAASTLPMT